MTAPNLAVSRIPQQLNSQLSMSRDATNHRTGCRGSTVAAAASPPLLLKADQSANPRPAIKPAHQGQAGNDGRLLGSEILPLLMHHLQDGNLGDDFADVGELEGDEGVDASAPGGQAMEGAEQQQGLLHQGGGVGRGEGDASTAAATHLYEGSVCCQLFPKYSAPDKKIIGPFVKIIHFFSRFYQN